MTCLSRPAGTGQLPCPVFCQKLWNDAQRFDLNPELSKLTIPTLVLTGRYDINVATSVAFNIHQAIYTYTINRRLSRWLLLLQSKLLSHA
jgi:pimeloyl-ACP methyl ester carboxylesterase